MDVDALRALGLKLSRSGKSADDAGVLGNGLGMRRGSRPVSTKYLPSGWAAMFSDWRRHLVSGVSGGLDPCFAGKAEWKTERAMLWDGSDDERRRTKSLLGEVGGLYNAENGC